MKTIKYKNRLYTFWQEYYLNLAGDIIKVWKHEKKEIIHYLTTKRNNEILFTSYYVKRIK